MLNEEAGMGRQSLTVSSMRFSVTALFCLTLVVPVSARVPDWLVHDITDRSRVVQRDGILLVTNGLIAREFTLAPDLFTSDFYSYEKESSLLRAITSEAQIGLDGAVYDIGGIITDTPRAYLNRTHLMTNMTSDPHAFQFKSYKISDPVAPIPYLPRRHAPKDIVWPPKGARIDFTFTAPASAKIEHRNITVVVTYEVYDGVPFLSKWVTIVPPPSAAGSPIAATIYSVEYLAVNLQWAPTGYNWLVTDTDVPHSSQVKWIEDPLNNQPGSHQPNVNCSYVDHFSVPLTSQLTSFRVRHLVVGSADQERQGFAKRRILRLLAPWTQENPIFFHMTHNANMTPYQVIDQMAEVGFEMLIYSFGYGFDIESTNESYINEVAQVVQYANDRGIEVGGYDLIVWTRTPPVEFAAIDPKSGKPTGNSCIASGWYEYLLGRFTSFMDKTGLSMVETDGPYPGYQCASKNHSHHRDVTDSVYWGDVYQAKFFQALQARGAYINQPDNYFYAGGSKTGMGYNEQQYSLPRWQDISVSRQGMFDDLFHYTPTVGWMFLPLVVYHGGGAAAEIEPLADHLKAYEWALAQYLGAGVAACYRGYRLYDGDVTKALVKKWVDFYKQYRDILVSDVVHVRRADMQGIDAYMHVNPRLATRGLVMVFNPTERSMAVNLTLPLYYTGLDDVAKIAEQGKSPVAYDLARDYSVELPVSLDAMGITWFTIA